MFMSNISGTNLFHPFRSNVQVVDPSDIMAGAGRDDKRLH